MRIDYPDTAFQFPAPLTREERNAISVEGQQPDMVDVLNALNELMRVLGARDLKDAATVLARLRALETAPEVRRMNNIRFAKNFPGDTADKQIRAAISDLPATGGVVDARGLQGEQHFHADPFSGVTKSVQLLLGAGTYITDAQIVIPNKCQVIGVGRGDPSSTHTVIKAGALFPEHTAVVRIGPASPVFNCRLENLTVDCSSIPGSIGVYTTHAQEMSGTWNVLVTGYMSIGIKYGEMASPYTAQNCHIEDVEVYAAQGASGATGIEINRVASFRGIHGATVNTNGGSQQAIGVRINGVSGMSTRIHIERHTTGILIGDEHACDTLTLIGVTGHTSATVTDLIKISDDATNQNINIFSVNKGNSTNAIVDEIGGMTFTSSSVGFYFLGNGSGSAKTRLHSDAGMFKGLQGAISVAGGITATGATMNTPATDGDVVGVTLSNVSNASAGTQVSLKFLADAAESRITAGRGGSTTDSFLELRTRKGSTTLSSALKLDNLAATFREKIVSGGDVEIPSSRVLKIAGTQVLTSQRTGWGTPTGTATRSAFATGSVTLEQLAQRVKALIDDLKTHGLLGTGGTEE